MEQDVEGMKEWIVGTGIAGSYPTWVEYKYLNFQTGASKCKITAKGDGRLRLRTSGGAVCGECALSSDALHTLTFDVSGLSGVQPIWFDFFGNAFELVEFCFSK